MPRAILLSALLATACADGAAQVDLDRGELAVDLRENVISMTATEVRAGTVTFLVRNRGNIPHDMVLIRSDLPADALPLDVRTQKASEDDKVGRLSEIAPGRSANLRLELGAGRYVVICNVPSHYQARMFTELVVR